MLDYRQAYYYSAYQVVSRSRPIGMGGPLAIPISEILAYCNLFYITNVDERDQLLRYVITIDNVYLEHAAEKSKSSK